MSNSTKSSWMNSDDKLSDLTFVQTKYVLSLASLPCATTSQLPVVGGTFLFQLVHRIDLMTNSSPSLLGVDGSHTYSNLWFTLFPGNKCNFPYKHVFVLDKTRHLAHRSHVDLATYKSLRFYFYAWPCHLGSFYLFSQKKADVGKPRSPSWYPLPALTLRKFP